MLTGTVLDGAGADVQFQASTTTIQANWTGLDDPQSGANYEWAIGTSQGGSEIQGYMATGITPAMTPIGAPTAVSRRSASTHKTPSVRWARSASATTVAL